MPQAGVQAWLAENGEQHSWREQKNDEHRRDQLCQPPSCFISTPTCYYVVRRPSRLLGGGQPSREQHPVNQRTIQARKQLVLLFYSCSCLWFRLVSSLPAPPKEHLTCHFNLFPAPCRHHDRAPQPPLPGWAAIIPPAAAMRWIAARNS